MKSLKMMRDEQQLVVTNHLLRLRRSAAAAGVSDSCSNSSSTKGEEGFEEVKTPLQDMSSLLLQLPLKRGLSKHYNGKSQSFTNLSYVKNLEDLAKQENPSNKKLKMCNTSSSSFISGGRNSSFLGNNNNNLN